MERENLWHNKRKDFHSKCESGLMCKSGFFFAELESTLHQRNHRKAHHGEFIKWMMYGFCCCCCCLGRNIGSYIDCEQRNKEASWHRSQKIFIHTDLQVHGVGISLLSLSLLLQIQYLWMYIRLAMNIENGKKIIHLMTWHTLMWNGECKVYCAFKDFQIGVRFVFIIHNQPCSIINDAILWEAHYCRI